jgi:4-hydroxybenzoate polyprenyltransferase
MLFQYCRQRLLTLRIGTAAVVIAAASEVAVTSWRSLPIDVLLGCVLIALFRIWDDLADRERDAVAHPGRPTVRAATPAPFVAACLLLAVSAFAIVALRGAGLGAASGLAALILLMALWYLHRGPRSLAGDHVLLLKYPMFVWIVVASRGGPPAPSLWLAMAAVFLAACVYEAVHDPTSPAARILEAGLGRKSGTRISADLRGSESDAECL